MSGTNVKLDYIIIWWASNFYAPLGSQTSNKRAFSFRIGPDPSHSSHSSFRNHDKYMTGPSVDGT